MIITESIRSIRGSWKVSVVRVLSLSMGLIFYTLVLLVCVLTGASDIWGPHEYMIISLLLVSVLLVTCASYAFICYNYAYKRSSEILIHKLYGASARSIFILLQLEYTILLITAALISIATTDLLLFNVLEFVIGGTGQYNLSAYPALYYIIGIGIGVMWICGAVPNILMARKNPTHILEKIYFNKR